MCSLLNPWLMQAQHNKTYISCAETKENADSRQKKQNAFNVKYTKGLQEMQIRIEVAAKQRFFVATEKGWRGTSAVTNCWLNLHLYHEMVCLILPWETSPFTKAHWPENVVTSVCHYRQKISWVSPSADIGEHQDNRSVMWRKKAMVVMCPQREKQDACSEGNNRSFISLFSSPLSFLCSSLSSVFLLTGERLPYCYFLAITHSENVKEMRANKLFWTFHEFFPKWCFPCLEDIGKDSAFRKYEWISTQQRWLPPRRKVYICTCVFVSTLDLSIVRLSTWD